MNPKTENRELITDVFMSKEKMLSNQQEIQGEAAAHDRTFFGFWIYLMTDLIIFAVLFATYAVLHNNTFGGPGAKQLFSLPNALTETVLLLTSSFTCGLAMLGAHKKRRGQVLTWFGLTFISGIAFLFFELSEFHQLILSGNTWQRSAFLSSFFTLVGTHGLHITSGLIWMAILLVYIWRKGLTRATETKLVSLSLFWHFLDIVWIFIFTTVYLMA